MLMKSTSFRVKEAQRQAKEEARSQRSINRQTARLLAKHGSWERRFALLPVRIDDEHVIWWERYERRLKTTKTVWIAIGSPEHPIPKVLPIFERRRLLNSSPAMER